MLERSGSSTTVGVVGLLFVLPWVGIGQVLTAWSARFRRRMVLVSTDGFRGIAFVAIGVSDLPTAPLLVLVGLTALTDPVFEATKSAFVTEIVPKDDYSEAIQVTHAANQAASLAGYALGGVVVGFVGAEFTLAMNGVTFLVSSSLIIAVNRPGTHAEAEASSPRLAAGLRFLRDARLSAVAFAATVVAVTAAMSVESQVAVYGKVVASFDDQVIGLLSAVTPAATLVAVAMLRTTGDDTALLRRGLLTGGAAAAGGSILLFSGVGGVGAFVAFALVGVIFSFVTMTNVVVGRRLPDDNRVTIFSVLQTGVFLGLSVGALSGGILSEATSPERAAGAALAIAGASLFAAIGQVGPE